MTLGAGTTLGFYEITSKLGEGGMGEVWRATDTKLKREVAIKVLPAAFTEDEERLARFEREAQILASLSHPNIASTSASPRRWTDRGPAPPRPTSAARRQWSIPPRSPQYPARRWE